MFLPFSSWRSKGSNCGQGQNFPWEVISSDIKFKVLVKLDFNKKQGRKRPLDSPKRMKGRRREKEREGEIRARGERRAE